jgi:1-acyl-sn-glycerol-3-phosphate acyltransferase
VRQWLGSVAFTAYLFLSVPVYALLVFATLPLPRSDPYRWAVAWAESVLFMLRKLCRLSYSVAGLENLPGPGSIVLMKHSSTWETLAQILIFPRQTWVLKQELLWIPLFGWALRLFKPIAIDREGGRAAVQQVLAQGQSRLAEGLCVVIFPEGTRMPVGQTRRYGLSGALLASAAGKPIVPVAHNAGHFWPRRGWLKRAGTVRVVIGEPIPTVGRDARQINDDAQRWIEAQVARLAPETANG